jgi:fructuronate reductase
MVTLTLTEKGYAVPDDKHEVSGRLSSGPGVVALGLAARRQAGLRAPVIASLDNLRQNGEVLRQAVMACAARFDPALVQWIADEVAFPSSVVDRMVPAPTASDREEASRVLGLLDLAGVKTEPHRSWVMTAVAGAPPLDTVGVRFVADVTPYEERKLRLLNGPHSALAYTGLAMGCQTIAEATSQPLASGLVSRLIDDILEVVPTALPEPARPFAEDVFHRFTNPALKHTCSKVGADGSQKLPERFEAVVAARQHAGLPTGRFSAVAALWIAAASGLSLVSKTLPAVEDPMADHLARIADEGDLPGLVRAAVGGWTTEVLQREVLHMLDALRKGGVEMLGGLQ